jgi:hypothetical protein
MKVDRRCIQFLVLTLAVMFAFLGASAPLQPLVQRNERVSGPAPAGCDESLAPAAPRARVDVAEIPAPQPRGEVVALTPPPSRSLRSELQDAQRALAGNDRPAFDRHLVATRALLDGYPPGGERNAASEAVRVLEDAGRVWDAQFASPFFAEGSDAYERASRYPGYAEAVRRNMLTDDRDQRFYPASESRAFLARIAAERLSRLGIRPVTQRADATSSRRTAASPSRRIAPKAASTTASAPRRTAESSARTPARRTPRSAPAASKKPTPATAMAASSAPDPSTPVRIAAADPAPAALRPSSSRVDETAPPAADVPPPPADPEPVVTDAAPDTAGEPSPSATSATSAAPETTTTPASTTQAVPERRSVVIPALLILIGLGVLIVLFRASN